MSPLRQQTSVAVVTAMTLAAPLAAAELLLEPRFAAGASCYNLDLDGEITVGSDSVDNVEFSDWLYLIGGGLTFSYDRFFVALWQALSRAGSMSTSPDHQTRSAQQITEAETALPYKAILFAFEPATISVLVFARQIVAGKG